MTEMAILYDSSLCTACKACQVACKCWNTLPSPTGLNENEFSGTYQNPPALNGDTRLIIEFREHETENAAKPVAWAFTRRSCKHCTDPGCTRICPGGALSKNEETGFVTVDESRCIACHYCNTACPFDVPQYYGPRGIVNKCTGCPDRIAQGLAPACVTTCQPGALRFGDRDEMIAIARERVEWLHEHGYPDAEVYGENEMEGLHVISVEKYGAEKHGEVLDPALNPVVSLTEVIRPVAAVGVGATVLGLAFSFLNGVGYHRDTMRYDEKTGDKIDVDTGQVLAHTDLATHETTHEPSDEAGFHWGSKKGGE